MTTTLDFFKATQCQNLDLQAGRLTLEQVLGLFDAITGIYVCCNHAYTNKGHEVPTWITPKLEKVRLASKLSIAQARKILGNWYRWTHPFHGDNVPDLSAVQGFIGTLGE